MLLIGIIVLLVVIIAGLLFWIATHMKQTEQTALPNQKTEPTEPGE